MSNIPLLELDAYLRGMHGQNEACREQLAAWMIANGFATGHGDSMGELLDELKWQVDELRTTSPQAQRQS